MMGDIFVVNTDGTELWTHQEPSGGGIRIAQTWLLQRDGFYVLDGEDDLSLVDTGGNKYYGRMKDQRWHLQSLTCSCL